MLDYVAQILAWRAQGLTLGGASDGSNPALWDYLTTLFRYAGFSLPNAGTALGPQGFIGVCDDATMPAEGCTLVAAAKTSGMRILKGALGGRFLVTGAPASCAPLGAATNLQPWGQCLEVSIDPKVGPSFRYVADPVARPNGGAIVQTCLAEGAPNFLAAASGEPNGKNGKLGQLSAGSERVSVRPPAPPVFRITEEDELAGRGCSFAQVVARDRRPDAGLWSRLASAALDALTPRLAYATHGGLGGMPGFTAQTSRFGPVDPFVFQATFTGDVVGQPPATPDRGRGSWTIETLNPGDVTVRASLADIASPLVVVNQQGGAAPSKPGIQLLGALATQAGQPSVAQAGVYRVRWRAVVATPKAFDANFNLLDAQGNVLASFTYANGNAAQGGPVLFNGAPTGLAWAQNVSAAYEITLDLDRRQVSFGLQGAAPVASGLGYAYPAAEGFAQFGWQIKSQNAQTIGTDDVEVVRVPDLPLAAP